LSVYTLEPERRTLHGKFSRELTPILTINPGDTVIYRTLDAGWNLGPRPSENEPPPKFEPRNPELDAGHCLVGPIAIRGAEPGMALEVEIKDIQVGTWGWSGAGGWKCEENAWLGVEEEKERHHQWTLNPDKLIGRNQYGHTVKLRPFMGVMGMPPDEAGRHSTAPPRVTGGNMDCKELVPGTTLYLPIAVSGGLFSVGDGHAVQGDGEISTLAIECPMERVELTFNLRPDLRLSTPRAETPAGWITLGFDEDLNKARQIAENAMLELMGELFGLSRIDALALGSLVVDLRITQVVNGVRGVHALLPHGALTLDENS
jgi:acetamidase/formamidase